MTPDSRGRSWSARAEFTYHLLFAATTITIVSMVIYLMVRVSTVTLQDVSPVEAVLAVLLLSAELFLMFHAVGYFSSVVKAARRSVRTAPPLFVRPSTQPVAVLVAAFNEPEDVLDQTLAAIRAMDYPAVHLYLLDDSTKEECRLAGKRLAARYGAILKQRTNRAGYKAGAINDLLLELDEEFVALLDADQRPTQAWLKDVIPMFDRSPKIAMIQAPQVYVNLAGLPVAEAAAFQQAVFFEYICEGKAHSNAIFCCGSNVVLRRSALLSIEVNVDGRRQFFDETTVTEDFATSFRLHAKGWTTDFINEPYVLGMGPETLPAYFTQHMRWSMGSMAVGLKVLRTALANPRLLTPGQYWEYLLSGSYYFVGWANLVFMFAPIAFLLFGIRPVRTDSDLYMIFFVPYIFFTMNLFFFGMKLRRYPVRGVWLASALSFASTWTYAKAAVVAVFGLKRAFAVTPKGVGGRVPISNMPVEAALFAINVIAAGVGLWHLAFVAIETAYVVTTLWTSYHAILLSTLFFHFNRPVQIAAQDAMFIDQPRAA
jgi:cellulose synthase (UDP-forming)